MFDILASVKKEEAYILERYTDFHLHPEVGGKEERTVKVVMEELKKFGIPCEHRPNGGIIGWINKGKPGKKVALRADMDALPMAEDPNNLCCARKIISKTDKAMHACGHDGHTAMLLAAAKVLSEHAAELPGQVVLLFEQGEEMGYGGKGIARMIIEEKPDTIWGIHLYNALPSGKISVDPGPRMAAGIFFEVEIRGKGGHGSRPDLSRNPLDCFIDVYSNLCSLKMNYLDPFIATTFSVGKVNMGTAPNIIPETVSFAGSFRVTDLEESKKAAARSREILDHCCALHHCTYEVKSGLNPSGMVVYNHKGYAALAEKSIKKLLGEEYLQSTPPWMASESMAMYLKYAPGVFAFVGINNPEKGTGAAHHNPHFEVDETVLVSGAAATVQYTLDALVTDVDTSDFTPNPYPPEELSAKPWLG
ncbi:MAG: M20 metallopeptidase family protein [bacterium]|jgi:amidohydrolase